MPNKSKPEMTVRLVKDPSGKLKEILVTDSDGRIWYGNQFRELTADEEKAHWIGMSIPFVAKAT